MERDYGRFCDTLERIARAQDPDRVWPFVQQGIKVFGTPLGHSAFVEAHLNKKAEEQALLLERIPAIPDLQSSWGSLASLCGGQSETTC